MIRTREWLLYNAVEAWLHHYSSPPSETVQQYKKLRDELHDTYIKTLNVKDAEPEPKPKPRTTRKRTNASKPAKTV